MKETKEGDTGGGSGAAGDYCRALEKDTVDVTLSVKPVLSHSAGDTKIGVVF